LVGKALSTCAVYCSSKSVGMICSFRCIAGINGMYGKMPIVVTTSNPKNIIQSLNAYTFLLEKVYQKNCLLFGLN
jgi:hypothetical protein